MGQKRTSTTGHIPVNQVKHKDTRTNLPTADAQEYVTPEIEAPKELLYPRNPALDPQLVWRGKDSEDQEDLAVTAPPIYIQEKIDPRVLIENLRDTARAGEPEPEAMLFESFDGLDELEAIDFYQHQSNWSNRMILGDSLQVMGSLAERESLRGQVQMIYIDPPYGIKFNSNWQLSTRSRDVKDGKAEYVAREAEQIKAFRDTWKYGISSYLSYLRDRLIAAHDLLNETGSVFVQISSENVHLVRVLLDEVFGSDNFCNQISFASTSGFAQAKTLGRNGDYILWYAKSIDSLKVRPLFKKRPLNVGGYNRVLTPDGKVRPASALEQQGSSLADGNKLVHVDNITSQGASGEPQPFEFRGETWYPRRASHWKASYPDGMRRLALAGRIHPSTRNLQYLRFYDDFPYTPYSENWLDTVPGGFTEEKLYVVQSVSKVVSRCMLLCTDPGDLVLDPTCGSGTTAYVAEQWGRRWITIDTSRVALALARQRLMGARFPYYLLEDSYEGRDNILKRTGRAIGAGTSPTNDIRHGFVYHTAPHITLKSIANNPDIIEGMTQEEIDRAIARNADQEILFDQPYEDNKRLRVSGPFTVESLTPHRSVSFDDSISRENEDSIASHYENIDDKPFDELILDNLRIAGIQNGTKNERLVFETLESHAGAYVQAIGEQEKSKERVAIVIGPQYGTVSARYVKESFKEAKDIPDVKLLCILGFAFDAQAGQPIESDDSVEFAASSRMNLGKLGVLFVRMNSDLLMGESLKKTGSGNLFTVFGEPDIQIQEESDNKISVDLKGVDIFDPTTGEIRSSEPNQIALWMIDSNYNGESFFVRHCYFTGGHDPYKKLKTALKSEIDRDAWETLYRTVSVPFDKPSTGKIAVKVINDYGDEVMQVFEIK